ncbi:hypothetical protein ACSVDA_11635 [Cytobacillus sp. Hm23]
MYRENKPFIISPYDHPDIYPGPRPPSSFVFMNGRVHKIEEANNTKIEQLSVHVANNSHPLGSFLTGDGEVLNIGELLESEGVSSIDNRFPVVAYGSNVCIAQLVYKFGLNQNSKQILICMKGTMVDSDIIFGPFLAPYGALPAVIAPNRGAQTEIWLTFLDKDQLELMDRTETGYELREHLNRKLTLQTGETFEKVYAYYYPYALKLDGTYYRFNDISSISTIPSVWQADMINRIKDLYGFTGTREEFIHLLRWNDSFHRTVEGFLSQYEDFFDHEDWLKISEITPVRAMIRKFSDY